MGSYHRLRHRNKYIRKRTYVQVRTFAANDCSELLAADSKGRTAAAHVSAAK
jgi:hypothetical protein